MANTIVSGTSLEVSAIWQEDGVGIKRFSTHAGMPVVLLNPDDIKISISGLELALDVSVDDLEAINASGVAELESQTPYLASISGSVDNLEALQQATTDAIDGLVISGLVLDVSVDDLEAINISGVIELIAVNVELDAQTIIGTSGVVELQAINTELDTQTTYLASISGATDNLEVLQQSTIDAIDGLATSGLALDVSVDDLEVINASGVVELQAINTELDGQTIIGTSGVTELQDVNANLESGIMIRDADGTTADVVDTDTVPSGIQKAVMVNVDTRLSVSGVLASGSISADAFSSNIDVSSQLGFYNNAILVGSDTATDIAIYASSDGAKYALVTTLTFSATDTFLYYDLKGYETDIKIMPSDNADCLVDLILNR